MTEHQRKVVSLCSKVILFLFGILLYCVCFNWKSNNGKRAILMMYLCSLILTCESIRKQNVVFISSYECVL